MTIFELHFWGITIAPTYYGLMYALGFVAGYWYVYTKKFFSQDLLDTLLMYVFFGVIVGGRLGYILFYDFAYYLSEPLKVLAVWEGGMSFHGGFLGVISATYVFCKRYKIPYLKLTDSFALIVTIGLGLGRIGNYLNKELLGYEYSGWLAVKVGNSSYFPSPLIEALLEGLVLGIILYFVEKYKKIDGITSAWFLIGYGSFRILVEALFREPDAQIGYIMKYFTMGELLSLPMVILGIGILV